MYGVGVLGRKTFVLRHWGHAGIDGARHPVKPCISKAFGRFSTFYNAFASKYADCQESAHSAVVRTRPQRAALMLQAEMEELKGFKEEKEQVPSSCRAR